jgi:DNA polymerase III delta subunit
MTCTVLVGDETICARQVQNRLLTHRGTIIDRLDAATITFAEILNAILSNSLFATSRVVHVDNLDKLQAQQIEQFANAVLDSGHVVYATSRTLNAAQRKALTVTFNAANPPTSTSTAGSASESGSASVTLDIIEFPAIDGRRGHETLATLADSYRVELSRPVQQRLLERVAHDPARLLSILDQCRIGAVRKPTINQIDVLCGSASAAGVPWDLGDRLERGDLPGAIRACADAIPLATLAYLGNRYQQALRLLETGAHNASDAASVTEMKNAASAERLFRLAKRVGHKNLEMAVTALADGDLLVKQHDHDGLRIVIGRITPLFSRR